MTTVNPAMVREQLLSVVIELRDATLALFEPGLSEEAWLDLIRERAARDWLGEAEELIESLARWAKQRTVAGQVRRVADDIRRVVDQLRCFVPDRESGTDPVVTLASGMERLDAVRAEGRGYFERLGVIIESDIEPVPKPVPNKGRFLEPAQRAVLQVLVAAPATITLAAITLMVAKADPTKTYEPKTVSNVLGRLTAIGLVSRPKKNHYSITDAGRDSLVHFTGPL